MSLSTKGAEPGFVEIEEMKLITNNLNQCYAIQENQRFNTTENMAS